MFLSPSRLFSWTNYQFQLENADVVFLSKREKYMEIGEGDIGLGSELHRSALCYASFTHQEFNSSLILNMVNMK